VQIRYRQTEQSQSNVDLGALHFNVVLFNLSAGEEPSAGVYIAKGTLCDDPNVCPIFLFIY